MTTSTNRLAGQSDSDSDLKFDNLVVAEFESFDFNVPFVPVGDTAMHTALGAFVVEYAALESASYVLCARLLRLPNNKIATLIQVVSETKIADMVEALAAHEGPLGEAIIAANNHVRWCRDKRNTILHSFYFAEQKTIKRRMKPKKNKNTKAIGLETYEVTVDELRKYTQYFRHCIKILSLMSNALLPNEYTYTVAATPSQKS